MRLTFASSRFPLYNTDTEIILSERKTTVRKSVKNYFERSLYIMERELVLKKDIINALEAAGVRKGQAIMVHSPLAVSVLCAAAHRLSLRLCWSLRGKKEPL